jgi:hypothetical protein
MSHANQPQVLPRCVKPTQSGRQQLSGVRPCLRHGTDPHSEAVKRVSDMDAR